MIFKFSTSKITSFAHLVTTLPNLERDNFTGHVCRAVASATVFDHKKKFADKLKNQY